MKEKRILLELKEIKNLETSKKKQAIQEIWKESFGKWCIHLAWNSKHNIFIKDSQIKYFKEQVEFDENSIFQVKRIVDSIIKTKGEGFSEELEEIIHSMERPYSEIFLSIFNGTLDPSMKVSELNEWIGGDLEVKEISEVLDISEVSENEYLWQDEFISGVKGNIVLTNESCELFLDSSGKNITLNETLVKELQKTFYSVMVGGQFVKLSVLFKTNENAIAINLSNLNEIYILDLITEDYYPYSFKRSLLEALVGDNEHIILPRTSKKKLKDMDEGSIIKSETQQGITKKTKE